MKLWDTKLAKMRVRIFEIGNYGAGTGASIGKINSMEFAMKSGLGYSEFVHESGLVVGAGCSKRFWRYYKRWKNYSWSFK